MRAERAVRAMAAWVAAAGFALAGARAAGAADAELARLVEAAKREGEVHFISNQVQPKTQAAMERAFKKKYGLPEGFKLVHTLRGTGEAVATVQQEIKAGQHTIDLIWVAGSSSFLKAAAREGHLLPHASAEWKPYERQVKRLGLEADPPNWYTPGGYAFVPVWNRKCPGFASVQIKSWRDLLNPAFKGKMVIGDVRKSFTYPVTWLGTESALGKDFWPKFVETTQPVILFRTEEILQKGMSCEYPIAAWQIPGRVCQRAQEDRTLEMAVAWPEEGVVVLGWPFAILKGTQRPNAARLLMDFFLSEEGAREYVTHEAIFTFREGFKVPDAVRPYAPEIERVKAQPVNWAALTLPEIKKIQDDFRRVLKVD